jgi:signal peptidase I
LKPSPFLFLAFFVYPDYRSDVRVPVVQQTAGSMKPALLIGDYFFVSKYSTVTAAIRYRSRCPFSGRIFAARQRHGGTNASLTSSMMKTAAPSGFATGGKLAKRGELRGGRSSGQWRPADSVYLSLFR